MLGGDTIKIRDDHHCVVFGGLTIVANSAVSIAPTATLSCRTAFSFPAGSALQLDGALTLPGVTLAPDASDHVAVNGNLDAGNQPFATTVPMEAFTLTRDTTSGYSRYLTYGNTEPFPSTTPFSLTMVMTETLSANVQTQVSQFFGVTAVPEPTTAALLGVAAPAFLARRRQRN